MSSSDDDVPLARPNGTHSHNSNGESIVLSTSIVSLSTTATSKLFLYNPLSFSSISSHATSHLTSLIDLSHTNLQNGYAMEADL